MRLKNYDKCVHQIYTHARNLMRTKAPLIYHKSIEDRLKSEIIALFSE